MLYLLILILGVLIGFCLMAVLSIQNVKILKHDCVKSDKRADSYFNKLHKIEGIITKADQKKESYYESYKKIKTILETPTTEL